MIQIYKKVFKVYENSKEGLTNLYADQIIWSIKFIKSCI